MTSKSAAAAEAAADGIIDAFDSCGNTSFVECKDFINEKCDANEKLTYRLAGMLRNPTTESLLDGTLKRNAGEEEKGKGGGTTGKKDDKASRSRGKSKW